MLSPNTAVASSWHPVDGFYRDARLEQAGISHGVTTRQLGNMKDPERRRQVLASAGLGGKSARVLKQVHGTQVWECGNSEEALEGDGWISTDPSYVPCVYAADCLPIFVWDHRDKSAVGIFHAGWRGVAAGMPRVAVRSLRRYGLTPERLAASVGPHVGACCYAVGPEVAQRFRPEVVKGAGRLDLGEEARLQLIESGLSPERVSISSDCTSCLSEAFFSFRREKMDLRMMAFISLPEAPHAH